MVRRTRKDEEPVGDIEPTGQKGLATAAELVAGALRSRQHHRGPRVRQSVDLPLAVHASRRRGRVATHRNAERGGAAPRVSSTGPVDHAQLEGRGAADRASQRIPRRGEGARRREGRGRRCSRRPSSSPSRGEPRNTCSGSWSRRSSRPKSCSSTAPTATRRPRRSISAGSSSTRAPTRYRGSPTADMRAALVEHFRDEAADHDRHRGRGRRHQPPVLQPGRQLRPSVESRSESSSASAAATATGRSSTSSWSTS